MPSDTVPPSPDASREKGDAAWLKEYNVRTLGKRHKQLVQPLSNREITVLKVTVEELCHQDSPAQLKEEIQPVLDAAAKPDLILDLSNVTYVASTLIGTLLWLQQMVVARGGRLCLAGVHWRVKELLEICNLENVLRMHPTVDEAMRVLGGGTPDTPAGF